MMMWKEIEQAFKDMSRTNKRTRARQLRAVLTRMGACVAGKTYLLSKAGTESTPQDLWKAIDRSDYLFWWLRVVGRIRLFHVVSPDNTHADVIERTFAFQMLERAATVHLFGTRRSAHAERRYCDLIRATFTYTGDLR